MTQPHFAPRLTPRALLLVVTASLCGTTSAHAFSTAPVSKRAVVAQVQPFSVVGGLTFGDKDGWLLRHNIVQRAELRLVLDAAVVDALYGLSGHHQWSVVGVAWNAGVGPLVAAKDQISAGARAVSSVYGTLQFDVTDWLAFGGFIGPNVDVAGTLLRQADARAVLRMRAGLSAKIIHPWVHAFVEGGTTFGTPSGLYTLGGNVGLALVWPL